MRYLFANLVLLALSLNLLAQAPQGFSWQSVMRDNTGSIISNQSISLRIKLIQGTINGTVVYAETHSATTNSFGLVNLTIGSGTVLSGQFSSVNWGSGPYFVQVELDAAGGSSFSLMGTSQLMSVPYALYAQNSGNFPSGQADGDMMYWYGNQWHLVPAGANGQNLVMCDGFPSWGFCPYPPSVSTPAILYANAPLSVVSSTVSLPAGGPPITAKGICWNTSGSPTISNSHSDEGPGAGTFSSHVNWLRWDSTYHFRAYATNAVGTTYSSEIVYTTPPFTCGTSVVTDYEGNFYNTVLIGSQCWMKENLKTTHYSDGSPIFTGNGLGNISQGLNSKLWFAINNNQGNTDSYGLLYTWAAAMNGAGESNSNPSGVQGICPYGMHVPSDAEWQQLMMNLGMNASQANSSGWIGTNQGDQLMDCFPWNNGVIMSGGGTSCTPSGFRALAAGYRLSLGVFTGQFSNAYFWSSTQQGGTPPVVILPGDTSAGYIEDFSGPEYVWTYGLSSNYASVLRDKHHRTNGFSVRCVKGEAPFIFPFLPVNMVNLTTDTFSMGIDSDSSLYANLLPHPVFLTPFQISQYEITNQQYCQFLNQENADTSGNVHGAFCIGLSTPGCRIVYDSDSLLFRPVTGYENHPVVCVSYYGARNYCQWAGGRLPTGAEWEYAARGGAQSQNYQYAGSNDPLIAGWFSANSGGTTHPVGQKIPNELGLFDMSGNVWEICRDWYDSTYYNNSPVNNPQGPTGPVEGTYRLIKGGGFDHDATIVMYGARILNPYYNDIHTGFRIVKGGYSPPPALPQVLTDTLLVLSENSVISTGEVIEDGSQPVTAFGVCWNNSGNPTLSDNHQTAGSGTGYFQTLLTNLSPGTYHLKAFATNGVGTAYGQEVVFSIASAGNFTCGSSPITDFDGNNYTSVQIGNQCWMKENLKTTRYADGTSLIAGTGVGASTALKYWFYYADNPSNKDTYGLLYTWTAAVNGTTGSTSNPSGIQGICPTGWHIPSEPEWTQLETFLGGSTIAGGKIKEAGTTHWSSPNTGGSNDYGFSALPAGIRGYDGVFQGLTTNATFWTTARHQMYDYITRYRNVIHNSTQVYSEECFSAWGFSVRCLKDGYNPPPAPTVTTSSVYSITQATAMGGGEVTDPGGSPVISRGICWDAAENPTISNAHTADGSGIGSFSSTITGLLPNTVYHVRAYATNNTGVAYGNDVQFTTPQAPVFTCGTSQITDFDNNSYNTLLLGTQCWMKENLKTTHYANGTALVQATGSGSLLGVGPVQYWFYVEDNPALKDVYGLLYTWHAAVNGSTGDNSNPGILQGICPAGWHLPSDLEWQQLELFLGMSQSQAGGTGMRGTDEGGKLKETGYSHWLEPNSGATNSSGFTALGAGYRGNAGGYGSKLYEGIWWTSYKLGSGTIMTRHLNRNYSQIDRQDHGTTWGYSVRCLKNPN